MKLLSTYDTVTWLVGDATRQQRAAAAAALRRWQKAGLLTTRRQGAHPGRVLWDLLEVRAALNGHVEKYGAPPWENGRGPAKK
ncbi:hypothetical protein [Streptomyces griseus]|uniref:hypothetical protein n=1 Tax=Streptomyces griseus TaxID=1911 RepID=UPI0033F616DC